MHPTSNTNVVNFVFWITNNFSMIKIDSKIDSSTFATTMASSTAIDRTHSHKSGKGRHKCDHCDKFGHKIDKCYALHVCPPKSVVVAQTVPVQPSTVDHISFDTPSNLLFSKSFLNGIRIIRILVSLLLLHIQVHLLLASLTLLPLALGF